jgi:hypothetical protein
MTILVVAVVALALLVTVAAILAGFLWISEHKVLERNH